MGLATAATAAFTGRTLPSEDGYFAFYPHSRFVRYEGDVDVDNTFIYFTLPSEQKAVAGGFERGLFPSYAVADAAGGEMQFTPVCGLVKFRLTGDAVADIASVSFDVMGYSVSGMFGLNTTFGWLEESPSCKPRVTLTGPFEAETDYYMVVMPGWLSDFYFTFTRNDGSVYLREGGIEDGRIAVGGMADFGTMELSEGDFAVPAEDDITDLAFIKAVEAAAGITFERNAAGYVPLTEANLEKMASVTELDLSFDDLFDASALRYFTGLRRLDCSYNNLGSLDVIDLMPNGTPEQVYARTVQCIREGVDLVGTACDVSNGTPLENLKAYVQACRDTPIPDPNDVDDCVRALGRARAKNLKEMADYEMPEGGVF